MRLAGIDWARMRKLTGYSRSYLQGVFRRGTPVASTGRRIMEPLNAALTNRGLEPLSYMAVLNPSAMGAGSAHDREAEPQLVFPTLSPKEMR